MRILNEENRGVIPDEVENALFGIEFGGEAADITFRNTLMVEMGDFFPQDEIFQQRRAARSGAQGVLVIGDAHALIGGQRIAFTPFAVRVERF